MMSHKTMICLCVGVGLLGCGLGVLSERMVTGRESEETDRRGARATQGQVDLSGDADVLNAQGDGVSTNAGVRARPSERLRGAGASKPTGLDGLLSYYAGLSPSELEKEAEYLLSPGRVSPNDIEVCALLTRLGEVMPKRALAIIEASGLSIHRVNRYRRDMFSAWMSRDPENAIAYFQEGQDKFAPSVFDVSKAASIFMQRDSTLQGVIARELASHDIRKGMAWVESLPPEQKTDAARMLMDFLPTIDPAMAMEWQNKLLNENNSWYADSTTILARAWATEDPEATFEWLKQNGGRYTMPMSGVLGDMLRRDKNLAKEYLERYVPESQKKQAYDEAYGKLMQRQPKEAEAWLQEAPSMSEEDKREIIEKREKYRRYEE